MDDAPDRGESRAPQLQDVLDHGVEIPVASKRVLIRMKDTIRESDAMDVRFLHMRIEEDEKNHRR